MKITANIIASTALTTLIALAGYIVVFWHRKLAPRDPHGPRVGSFLISLGAVWGGLMLAYTILYPQEALKQWPYPALDPRTTVLVALVAMGLIGRVIFDRTGFLHMLFFSGIFAPPGVSGVHFAFQKSGINEPWPFFIILTLALIYATPFGVERFGLFLRTLFRDVLYWTAALAYIPWRLLGYLGRVFFTLPPREDFLVTYTQVHEPLVVGFRVRTRAPHFSLQCPVCRRTIILRTVNIGPTSYVMAHNTCIHLHAAHNLRKTREVHVQFRLPVWNSAMRISAEYREAVFPQSNPTEHSPQRPTNRGHHPQGGL